MKRPLKLIKIRIIRIIAIVIVIRMLIIVLYNISVNIVCNTLLQSSGTGTE